MTNRWLAGFAVILTGIWAAQAADDVLCQQMLVLAETLAGVLRSPPQAGQKITEWAKQQACRKRALETQIEEVPGFGLGWSVQRTSGVLGKRHVDIGG